VPTIAYDFNEAGDFADFIVLEAGNYVFKFKGAEPGKSKAGNPKAVVDLVVSAASPGNAWAIGGLVRQHWATKGGSSGKFRDFLAALGATPKEKGSLKLEKFFEKEIGARVIKTPGDETDAEGQTVWFNDLRGMMPGDQMRKILGASEEEDDEEYEEEEEEEIEDDDEEEEVEEGEEDEDEEDEEDEEEEESDEDEEEEDDDEEEELTLEDLKSMKLPELIEVAKVNDVSTRAPKGKKLTVGIMRSRLAKLFEDEEDEGEEDPF